MRGLESAMKPAECFGEHERHEQDARTEDKHMLGLAQAEATDAADQHVADGEVEETP